MLSRLPPCLWTCPATSFGVLAAAIITGLCLGTPSVSHGPADDVRLRRPIAMEWLDVGGRLAIANRDSGTVIVVEAKTRAVVSEVPVAERLVDLSVAANRVVTIDESAGELIVLSRDTCQVVSRRKVGVSPVGVCLSNDGRTAVVSLLWPRQLALVPLDTDAEIRFIDLPFAPRRLLVVPGTNRVIVADAFGGQLGVVDLESRSIVRVRSLGVQNIRGLTLDPSRRHLYLTHQFLNATAPTQKGEIQNGNVVSNNVRKLTLAGLIDVSSRDPAEEQVYSIGDIDGGAGDPAGLAIDGQGQALVALAGVNEFAIGRLEDVIWTRLPVGRRPTAVAFDETKGLAYVANTFGDSLSIVDVGAAKVVGEIPLGTMAKLQPHERGELLFHDARRSHEAWMSCQSCHPDGHTTGRLNDNFSDGSFGTPKRILSLLGVRDTGPWAWHGTVATLEDQVRGSFKTTMQGGMPKEDEVRDVAAYLRTLSPPPSVRTGDKASRERGQKLFERLDCIQCHKPPLFTSPRTFDVGLGYDGEKFSPPSLRGIRHGGPYFHDNRAQTLTEVFNRIRHQIDQPLSAADQADLEAYLNGL